MSAYQSEQEPAALFASNIATLRCSRLVSYVLPNSARGRGGCSRLGGSLLLTAPSIIGTEATKARTVLGMRSPENWKTASHVTHFTRWVFVKISSGVWRGQVELRCV